jgi:hypothetical protein
LYLGLGIAFVMTVPSVIWQLMHGFPFIELVRNAGRKNLSVTPVAFALNQVVVFDWLFAPIWLSGLIAPFVMRDLRGARFLAPAYPPLLAIGAVAIERTVRNARRLVRYTVAAVAVALVSAPLALPILSPEGLIAYQRAIHARVQPQEKCCEGDALPPTFADMLGWRDFVGEVGVAYDSLPPGQRARTSILVDNYGEAAALDVYGTPYGLPPALSGHNQYFFWGRRGQDPENVLRVQSNPERLRPYCAQMLELGTTQSRYARSFENKSIAFCRGVHPSLAKLWPSLKVFI